MDLLSKLACESDSIRSMLRITDSFNYISHIRVFRKTIIQ